MSFLSSIFLWALPLAALPVIVHLFNRRRQEVIRWGAMQFLLETASRRRRIWRVDDLILMLIRAAAVLAIVLALARPLVTSTWLGSPAGREVFVVLDDSMSTARTVEGSSTFEAIVEQADALIADLSDGDTVRLLLASGGGEWLTPMPVEVGGESKLQLRQRLAELRPSLGTADMLACLQTAVEAEPGEAALARFIIVLTDGCAHGWQSEAAAWQNVRRSIEAADAPATINIVQVEVAGADGRIDNLSVDEIETARTVVGVGEPFTLTAQLRNLGGAVVQGATLEWQADGEALGLSSFAPIAPQQATGVPFEHVFEQRGVYQLKCAASRADQLELDNAATLIVEAVESVPILVVGQPDGLDPLRSDTGYLLAALGRRRTNDETGTWRSVFDPTVMDFDELADAEISGFHAVVLVNVPSVRVETIEKLRGYVDAGGGLWIALGPRSEAESFNAQWFGDGGGLLPFRLNVAVGDADDRDKFALIHPPSAEHPATRLLGDTQRLDMDEVQIFRRYQLEQVDAGRRASVLLETGGGEPLAVETFLGRGRVIVQGLPLGIEWSNLPACQVYVPLVHEWLWYLSRPSFTPGNLQIGEPIVVARRDDDTRFDDNDGTAATIETPRGESLELFAGDGVGSRKYRFPQTRVPGEYLVSLGGGANGRQVESSERQIPFYVARDVEESNLEQLSSPQKDQLAQSGAVHFVADPFAQTLAGEVKTHREPIWNALLAGALILMAAELALAGWSARRKFASGASAEATAP